jgi:hypothetical protein
MLPGGRPETVDLLQGIALLVLPGGRPGTVDLLQGIALLVLPSGRPGTVDLLWDVELLCGNGLTAVLICCGQLEEDGRRFGLKIYGDIE